MKNKRNIFCVLLSLAIALSLTSCKEKDIVDTAFSIYTVNVGTDGDSLELNSEYALWRSDNLFNNKDSTAKQNVTVNFEGGEYTGNYSMSFALLGTNQYVHRYQFDGGNFYIDSETGRITDMSIYNFDKGNMTLQECQKIANKIASKYTNINNMELTVQQQEPPLYVFEYRKYLCGEKTTEFVKIALNSSGQIVVFENYMNNKLPEISEEERYRERIEAFFSQETLSLIENEIDNIYNKNFKDSYQKYEYTIKQKELTMSDDDKLAAYFLITITVSRDLDNGDTYSSHVPIAMLLK